MMRKLFIFLSLLGISLITVTWFFYPKASIVLAIIIGPFILIGTYDMIQVPHTLMRNYPIVGRFRYWMEVLRPKIYQYFVESDIDGRPINRIHRSVVYQRAKNVRDTTPFGTQLDVYEIGYEWINHSINALDPHSIDHDPRVNIGGHECKHPYSASIFNISAMSFGSLSKNAILSLNGGAKLGGFAHNTGEGSVSPYHLEKGGDLIWQIGTGYFGCRDDHGRFSPEKFQEKATLPNVKMIELKLSQGAKPGHGGILPAAKNNQEIAKIRGVTPHTTVLSPSNHSAFNSPKGLLEFVKELRELSGGKPVGFKLCIGNPNEFVSVCLAMKETGILPDFITVDGGEGGTGAAPLEFSNSIGMPLRDGLTFVIDVLRGFNLKKDIRVIASGKVITGFDIVKCLALGADACNSARGMMLALGCIQALECNSNKCPTGIATQDPGLYQGLVPKDKQQRIFHFHKETVKNVAEIIGAAGFKDIHEVKRCHIYRRISNTEVKRYDQIYPVVEEGSFLEGRYPKHLKFYLENATSDNF